MKVSGAGNKNEKGAWGKPADWCHYSGTAGGTRIGAVLMPDPNNFRRSWFHVRDYGLFTLSPFGQKSYTDGMLPEDPLTLEPGKSIRLRYGLYVHDGDTEQSHVSDVYEAFVKGV